MILTIFLDDDLVATAQSYTGIDDHVALMREALKSLIERDASR